MRRPDAVTRRLEIAILPAMLSLPTADVDSPEEALRRARIIRALVLLGQAVFAGVAGFLIVKRVPGMEPNETSWLEPGKKASGLVLWRERPMCPDEKRLDRQIVGAGLLAEAGAVGAMGGPLARDQLRIRLQRAALLLVLVVVHGEAQDVGDPDVLGADGEAGAGEAADLRREGLLVLSQNLQVGLLEWPAGGGDVLVHLLRAVDRDDQVRDPRVGQDPLQSRLLE